MEESDLKKECKDMIIEVLSEWEGKSVGETCFYREFRMIIEKYPENENVNRTMINTFQEGLPNVYSIKQEKYLELLKLFIPEAILELIKEKKIEENNDGEFYLSTYRIKV